MERRTHGCPGKGPLFLFLLLSCFNISCAFYERRREDLKTLRNDLLEDIKYVKTQCVTLAEYSGEEKVESELDMNHFLSSLLEMGDSITDEEELEMFQNDLQAVVNEVEWQRLNDRQLFLVEAKRIYANIEEEKKKLAKQIVFYPSLEHYVLHHNAMQILEDIKKYIVLRFWSITAEAEDIERILKIYHVSEFEHPIDNDLDFSVSEFENELQEDFDFYFPESEDELGEDLDFYVSEYEDELHEEL